MSCSRCNGCMVEDSLLDMEDSSGPMWLQANRCMNCGNVDESLLRRNRQTQGVNSTSGSSPIKKKSISLGAGDTAHLAA